MSKFNSRPSTIMLLGISISTLETQDGVYIPLPQLCETFGIHYPAEHSRITARYDLWLPRYLPVALVEGETYILSVPLGRLEALLLTMLPIRIADMSRPDFMSFQEELLEHMSMVLGDKTFASEKGFRQKPHPKYGQRSIFKRAIGRLGIELSWQRPLATETSAVKNHVQDTTAARPHRFENTFGENDK